MNIIRHIATPHFPFSRASMMRTAPADVLLIDDDGILHTSVEPELRELDINLRVFHSAADFLAKFDPFIPACLLLDIHLPGVDGHTLHDHLRHTVEWLPIIYFAGHLDWTTAVAMMRAGAWDVLEKPLNKERLLETVTDALRHVAEFRRFATMRSSTGSRLATLSKRESEVLHWILDGLCSREIADLLGTSPNTVEKQRANILHKLGAKSVAELVGIYYAVDPEHRMPRAPGSGWWTHHPAPSSPRATGAIFAHGE